MVVDPKNEINKQQQLAFKSPEWKEDLACKNMRDTWDSYRAVGIQLVSSLNRLDVIPTRMFFQCATTCLHNKYSHSRLQAMKVLRKHIRRGNNAFEE